MEADGADPLSPDETLAPGARRGYPQRQQPNEASACALSVHSPRRRLLNCLAE